MLQLDKTHIAIRERGLLDLSDLALHVLRDDFQRLTVMLLIGAVPFAIMNHLFLRWIMDFSYFETTFWIDNGSTVLYFCWHSLVLVFLEAPLATIFVTSYLGQLMFFERPSWREVLRETRRLTWPLLLCHAIERGVGFACLLYLGLRQRQGDSPGLELLIVLVFLCVFGLRAFRPFISEIVVLERTPVWSREKYTMTVFRRSSQLHGPASVDLFGRYLAVSLLAGMLFSMLFGSFIFCSGVLLNDWSIGSFMISVMMPVAMWIVAGYTAVVRFLNYLDVRIRQEGWEVELRLRAEGTRLTERII